MMFAIAELEVAAIDERLNNDPEREVARFVATRLLETCLLLNRDPMRVRAFVDAVRRLPLDLQLIWIEIAKLNMLDSSATQRFYAYGEACSGACSRESDIVLGVESASDAHCACGREVLALSRIRLSRVLKRVDAERRGFLRVGESRDGAIRRIQALLLAASSVTVVDRYAALNSSSGSSGLEWLLGEALVAGGASFQVISGFGFKRRGAAYTRAAAIADLENLAIRQASVLGRPVHFDAVLEPDRTFRDYAHDRFIKFVVGRRQVVVQIGRGVDALGAQVVTSPTVFGIVDENVLADFEQHLRAVPQAIAS